VDQTSLASLVARLWPFMRMLSIETRKATLAALNNITTTVAAAGLGNLLQPVLSDALTHTFQSLLLEDESPLVPLLQDLWRRLLVLCPPATLAAAVRPRLVAWFTLLVTPAGRPMDRSLLVFARPPTERKKPKAKKQGPLDTGLPGSDVYVIGGPHQQINIDPEVVLAARLEGADALGLLAARWQMEGVKPIEFYQLAQQLIEPNSGTKRLLAGAMLSTWAISARRDYASEHAPGFPRKLRELVESVLGRVEGLAELNDLVMKMRRDATEVVVIYGRSGIDAADMQALGEPKAFDRTTCVALLDTYVPAWDAKLNSDVALEARRARVASLRSTLSFLAEEYERLRLACSGTLACALTQAGALPQKLKPIIEPLMEAVKREEHFRLQKRCAVALASMLQQTSQRQPSPNDKITGMLYNVLLRDPEVSPIIGQGPAALQEGVYTLHLMALEEQAEVDKQARLRSHRKKGEAGGVDDDDVAALYAASTVTAAAAEEEGADADADGVMSSSEIAKMSRRGIRYTLEALADEFQADLFAGMPALLSMPLSQLKTSFPPRSIEAAAMTPEEAQKAVVALAQLETLAPTLPAALHLALLEAIPYLLTAIVVDQPVVRYKASLCLAAIARLPACREPVRRGVGGRK
jgi:hypothetical protein